MSLADGGTYVTGMDKTNPWWQVQGRWFQEDAQECVVGQTFATRSGVKIDSILNIKTPQGNLPLLVTGILSGGGPEDDAIVAPLTIAQTIAGKPGESVIPATNAGVSCGGPTRIDFSKRLRFRIVSR